MKTRNTSPEIKIRSILFSKGYRFKLHDKRLPGKPDIVLPKHKVVINVNGCFWHYHGCSKSNVPKLKTKIWVDKLEYNKKRDILINQGLISGDNDLYLQEYSSGVLAYLQFFYSPIEKEIEFFGVDKRHESDIEGLARIPAKNQLNMEKSTSFNVIANSPLVLRESLLDNVYAMGENFVNASAKLVPPGMNLSLIHI